MQRNGSHPAVAGLVGAAIGAAVGSAATAILTDQEKRTKVTDALKGFHKKALNAADSFKAKTSELQEKTEDALSQTAKTLEDGAERSKRLRKAV